ncbi:MAG: signal peptidase I [Flavobacterium sp.]|nr:signal peptidase I [Flavobacterium sp.]
MTTYQWFVFFLIVQLIHGLGTWKLYEKAGRKSWEAFVPVYNSIVLMKIINRPTWWTFLLFIPVINLIMFPIVWVETLRSFGKNSTFDTILGIATLGFYIYYVNYTQNVNHIADRSLKPKSAAADTISSLLFAVIVATFVHTYFIQPFTIPTSSLEKSLLVGDFLFVSKYNYGARVPMTTVAAPMVHDTIPIVHTKSYSKWPQLPYFRLPGYEKIKNNDIVVFNWPVDTVYKFFDRSGLKADKPIDKKSNYVKRCVAIPGDTFEIRDGIIFINGKESILPERAKPQYIHTVYSKKGVSSEVLGQTGSTEYNRTFEIMLTSQEQLDALNQPGVCTSMEVIDKNKNLFKIRTEPRGVPKEIISNYGLALQEVNDYEVQANLTLKAADLLRKSTDIDSVVRVILPRTANKAIFPHTRDWSLDNFGPMYIPQQGKSVQLDLNSLPLYSRIITEYEGKKLEIKGSDIYINDKKTTSYTFDQNYFWMMGDNRHRSEDSRYWGFVPENHIVGKPIFIWMSIDGINDGIRNWSIRWDRLFTTVSGEGEPQSYFKYFLGLLALYFVGEYFWKKRKKVAN